VRELSSALNLPHQGKGRKLKSAKEIEFKLTHQPLGNFFDNQGSSFQMQGVIVGVSDEQLLAVCHTQQVGSSRPKAKVINKGPARPG